MRSEYLPNTNEPQPGTSHDVLLLDRFIDGDDGAFAELFDRHNHRLFLYCLKIVGSAEQSEDLLQELWEKVIKLRLKPQKVLNPAAFLVTIARNLCFNHLKSQRRRTFLNSYIPLPDTTETIHEYSELEELVQQGLAKLPLDFREVLVLNIYCDYDYDEIAALLGKTVTAIRMRASRARAQLRTILEQSLDAEHRPGGRVAIERLVGEGAQ